MLQTQATMALMSSFVHRRQFTIEWGHCDPAGIVFNSRFFEFFDWSSWLLFEAALGLPCRDLPAKFGIASLPLADAQALFLKPVKLNDVVEIASHVSEFRRSSFDVQHRISVAGVPAVEGTETRIWAIWDPHNPLKLKGAPVPHAVIERLGLA
jgi:4-hydroxybenzoyl-CoA thioesterase